MESVIVHDFGVMLGRSSECLVVRGAAPRLELVEGGPQLRLPFDPPPAERPALSLVTSSGAKEPAPSLRLSKPKPRKGSGEPSRFGQEAQAPLRPSERS